MEDKYNAIRNRPRFKLKTSLTPEEFTQRFRKSREKGNFPFKGKINLEESYVEVDTESNPVWKPRLTLRAETNQDGETEIRGVYGPKPSVWTFFMFLYFIFGTSFFIFGSIYLSTKLVQMGEGDSTSLWSGAMTIFCLLAIIIVFSSVKIGQFMTREQMKELRKFAENIALKLEKEEELQ